MEKFAAQIFKTILTLYTVIESQARTWMDIHFMEYKHTTPLIRRTVPLEKYRKKTTNKHAATLPASHVYITVLFQGGKEQNSLCIPVQTRV